ncbi:SpoIIE family protein phosphatase [Streptomyces sp. NA04227]|uniref:SpoIIE family protein phosphatase/ATP-binding protein n=1 Tax=Streptomyces sp. NA04227 TaxID=2742136 RepID=UPI0015901D07|nr:SpoIIE family protein phosphatase/ATP-binding protein [Streptomyces sp. NA04227]QKW10179.1 SpoIIE family protein phosphatase [Streptomyces sp. NA04227]
MFALQVAMVLLLVAAAVASLVVQARSLSEREARNRSVAVAQAVAHSRGIVAALQSDNPTALLQRPAEATRKTTGVDFVVVMSTEGIRYTAPRANLIGKHFIGTIEPALAGDVVTETVNGTAGTVIQAVAPVTDAKGSVVGLVSAGFTVKRVSGVVMHQLPLVLSAAAAALALATAGVALTSRRLRRQTHGLGPTEMTRMYEHHDAVLHSVREGVLITGGDGRLLLVNDEARRLLDLPKDSERRHVADLGLDPRMTESLISGQGATDEVHLAGDRLLAVNVRPTAPHGGPASSVMTLRDTTELRALAGRAEAARERLQLLYDAGVRIGTTLDVVRTAQELTEVAVPRFADVVTVELLEPVLRGDEPAERSTEMRRVAVSGVLDSPLDSVGELIRFAPTTPMASSVASGRAVLEADLGTADGWQAQDPERARQVLGCGIRSLISVPLQARGVVLGLADFWRLESTGPFEAEDPSFAEELAARAAVAIDNARRYTREHTMAVTLQRSLLPRELPEQTALEVAHRYLPAQAGVGGDWYDVIPLPGARVALVVGDVVGHGLHAAATMGRLRTAVYNFSALDLSPDELLSHLDELVAHLDADEAFEGESDGITGATCLYAVYDPVSGVCTISRSGHLGPALVHPDGTVTFPDIPLAPPLGLGGGLPFETAALRLPEGSQLALFTDGLVENRYRDLDTGLGLLRDALAHPDRTPEETCQAVFDALLPECPGDDIALLVARTQLMESGQVADWEVPSDPAAVARIRAACAERLEAWGLEEISFVTELVVSELVTNAIRYGTQPINLRLLHDRNSLICEVADGSSTSPHLRRAATADEGGRGLFLVAQFAQRWGTRHTARGKIIWTEQALHDGATEPSTDLTDILLEQWDE